jgi:hypothetical protein
VEHWGGQQPASPDRNLSGHTQVDGPTAVEDRDKTEANRTLLKTYRDVITVQQHYDRIGGFLADDYVQHAAGFGDGIERVKARYAVDVELERPVLVLARDTSRSAAREHSGRSCVGERSLLFQDALALP